MWFGSKDVGNGYQERKKMTPEGGGSVIVRMPTSKN